MPEPTNTPSDPNCIIKAANLGEALRRIGEGAAMIRTKGEAGTGNVVEAVTHMRQITDEMRRVKSAPAEELMSF